MKLLGKRVTRRGLLLGGAKGGSGVLIAVVVGCDDGDNAGSDSTQRPSALVDRRSTPTAAPNASPPSGSVGPSVTQGSAPTTLETRTPTRQLQTPTQPAEIITSSPTQAPVTSAPTPEPVLTPESTATPKVTPAPVNPAYVEVAGQNFVVENGGGLTGEQLLNQLAQSGYLNLLGDHYPPPIGSVFVTQINGTPNSDGKYWVFEIDQQRVDRGASLVSIPAGSTMSWALRTPL